MMGDEQKTAPLVSIDEYDDIGTNTSLAKHDEEQQLSEADRKRLELLNDPDCCANLFFYDAKQVKKKYLEIWHNNPYTSPEQRWAMLNNTEEMIGAKDVLRNIIRHD
ncbi:MAG: hypothetical protein AAF153_02210, partial [Pseudomonadota bacterium]